MSFMHIFWIEIEMNEVRKKNLDLIYTRKQLCKYLQFQDQLP